VVVALVLLTGASLAPDASGVGFVFIDVSPKVIANLSFRFVEGHAGYAVETCHARFGE
jgi:hypothetical protein